jgi:hypothetical protein
MSVRPEVQEELRLLFRQGATPSRLIQLIAERHRGEQSLHGLIQIYFLETFGVPIVRGLNPLDDYESIGLKYAFLNDDVLHWMIEARTTWDQSSSEQSWLDALTATSIDERLRKAKEQPYSELSRNWDKLDDKERFVIQRLIAGLNGRSEQVRILARLAERLQQRVNELEGERAAVSESELASKNGE